MKKLLFFHIGPHRTASTYIQNTLRDNQALLLSKGICYPSSGMDPDGTHNSLFSSSNPANLIQEIDHEFSKSNAKALFLSAEEAFSFGPEHLSKLFSQWHVLPILCLRSIAPLMHSLWSINICYDNYLRSYPEFLRSHPYIQNYSLMLAKWKKAYEGDLCPFDFYEARQPDNRAEPIIQLFSLVNNYGFKVDALELSAPITPVNFSLTSSQLCVYQSVLNRIKDFEYLEHFNRQHSAFLIECVLSRDWGSAVYYSREDSELAWLRIHELYKVVGSSYARISPNSICLTTPLRFDSIRCFRLLLTSEIEMTVDILAHTVCDLSPPPCDFNGETYWLLNKDVAEAKALIPSNHWRQFGAKEGRRYK